MTESEAPVSLHPGPWHCFHCGVVCETWQKAVDHFGYTEMDLPVCIEAATRTQEALIEDRRDWRERCQELSDRLENVEHSHHHLLYDIREIIRREATRQNRIMGRDLCDFKQVWESMEGKMLAAESALSAAPRWLQNFLRRKAERAETRRMHRVH